MKPITCLVAATVAGALAISAHAQVNTDAVDSILRAYALGQEMKLRREALAFQQQVFEAQQIARGSAEVETLLLDAGADPAVAALSAEIAQLRFDAEHGDADAQTSLGIMYATGDGVPVDHPEAVRWFRLAAEQGNANAQSNLGVIAKRERLLLLAAEQGDADAQTSLGFYYATGQGGLKDEAEAVRWYRLAADQGNATAQATLGFMYSLGEGVLKDSVLAHMWSNIAGANGSETAREVRDILEPDMTRAEIRRATEMARTCMASNYQDCEP